jgi:signal transduction histidine kinase
MNARVLRAGVVVAGVFLGLYGYHLLRADLHSPVANAVASIAVAWTFLAAGIVAWARRPESRVGMLMTFVAFCLLERKLQYSHNDVEFTFGFLFGELGITVALAHAVLTYPEGRLRLRPVFERRFIATSYAVVIGFSLAQLLVWDHARTCIWSDKYCAEPRPTSLIEVYGNAQVFDIIRDAYTIGVYGILTAIFIGLIVRRVSRATHAGRRLLAPLMLAAAFAATRAVSEAILGFLPHSHAASEAFYWWQITGQIAVPLALLWGLLTAQLARGTIADLVLELGHTPPSGIRDVLARALGDPTLEVAFWLPERRAYVDVDGTAITLPDDHRDASASAPHTGKERALTYLTHDREPIAALIHDPALRNDPGLVEAAGEAARLALENARLQADVRSQLSKVQESRRRIVTAGDEQRRKIERDLHDGAQQRLVALALELRLAHRALGKEIDPELERVLESAVGELQVAVDELRELARGVHPAVLTEEGLAVAIESLAARTPLPVKLVSAPEERLAPEIEAAAYFVVCEALANAVKHARASSVRITAERRNGKLVIEVADDGVGGASANGGSGLRGLVDRVEAHGGTLRVESEPGRGTRVIGELPCVS